MSLYSRPRNAWRLVTQETREQGWLHLAFGNHTPLTYLYLLHYIVWTHHSWDPQEPLQPLDQLEEEEKWSKLYCTLPKMYTVYQISCLYIADVSFEAILIPPLTEKSTCVPVYVDQVLWVWSTTCTVAVPKSYGKGTCLSWYCLSMPLYPPSPDILCTQAGFWAGPPKTILYDVIVIVP